MSTKPKANSAPKLFLTSGKSALAHRTKLGISQSDFWKRVSVTQSGGSRYENGRNIPSTVQLVLHLTYASEEQAQAMLSQLRKPNTAD
ncbi:MAG: helix-turn-helix transcriptional regulator [Propionivibrio sp.]|uniref:helix-turn-helix domain-containing protein n=1 Tax=Propionivibrio sp. TaxID=2212460 RepID=UPI001A5CE86E|nr:helix-turn-helix transcriptional regulator [Propionivibrio sp.]MBL8414993.1 helix-turn-helix transcriptional regulator [Propionivibrio sp.]